MSGLLHDLRYALRRLTAQPGFTAIAVLTLGLGIGANTAIFSVLHALLRQSLPVQEPERLVLWTDAPDEGTISGSLFSGRWEYIPYPLYRDLRQRLTSLSGLAALRSTPTSLNILGESGRTDAPAQMGNGQLVSGNYFSLLGVTPLLGRALTDEDDRPGAPAVAVISYGYWQSRLGGTASSVGRVVQINGTPVTIVGVMGPEFFGERLRKAPDYWVPLQLQPQLELTDPMFDDNTFYGLRLLGRLAPAVTLAGAELEVNLEFRRSLAAMHGGDSSPEVARMIAQSTMKLVPGFRGVSGLRSRYEASLTILAWVVLAVLLVACANVANLLLARAASRQTEITVRLALGATGGRLTRQMLTEGLVLAAAGGLAGLLFAAWGGSLLVATVAPTSPIDAGLSPLALGFTAAISLGAGVLFSLAPALRSGRLDLASALKVRAPNGGGTGRRTTLSSSLVVAQVALCLVLLVGSGLLIRSLGNLEAQPVGFQRQQLLLVRLQTRLAGYQPAQLEGLYRRLLDQVNTIPGVTSSTLATFSPLGGRSRSNSISVEGYQPAEGEQMQSTINLIGPRYAETMGMPLRAGREIGERDVAGAPQVAMVNEAFARAYFKTGNAVGQRMGMGDDPDERARYEIIGVVGDARFEGPDQAAVQMVFLPMLQVGDASAFTSELALRVSGDAAAIGPAVRAAVAAVDPRLPISEINTMDTQFDQALFQPRLFARLVSIFGAVAVLLACVGLYGVVAQSVARRTNELGIRMALGADRDTILRMVLRETLGLIGLGLLIGIPAALGAAQLLRGQLFGVGPAEPVTIGLTSLLLVAVATVAGYLPARRAAAVAPMTALRGE